MPKALLDFLGFKIYFWSNENNEPVHVHISKGNPIENATKFCIKGNDIMLVHNKSEIPANDLAKIHKYLWANRNVIIARWYQYFGQ